jgi:hypothetical protein
VPDTDDGDIGFITGRITIVQEDRIRLVDDDGRGYLFVVRRGAAPTIRLEAWCDAGTLIGVEYRGRPDAGALALALRPMDPEPEAFD